MNNRPYIPRLHTAYHEAGHGVCAFHLGCTGIHLEIYNHPSGTSHRQGVARYHTALHFPLEKRLTISLAGPCAEYIHNGYWCDGPDLVSVARKCGTTVSRLIATKAYKTARQQSMRLIKGQWPAIKRIALKLHSSGQLDHHEITSIINNKRRMK